MDNIKIMTITFKKLFGIRGNDEFIEDFKNIFAPRAEFMSRARAAFLAEYPVSDIFTNQNDDISCSSSR